MATNNLGLHKASHRLRAMLRYPATLYIAFAFALLIESAALYLTLARHTVTAAIGAHQIRHVVDNIYATPVFPRSLYQILGDHNANNQQSNLVVLEDGRPLGPAHANHEYLRQSGRGLYSHWHHMLYFSTSDNSDPRNNGRIYTYSGQTSPTLKVYVFTATFSALVVLLGFLIAWRIYHIDLSPSLLPLKLLALVILFVTAPWLWLDSLSAKTGQLYTAGEYGLLGVYLVTFAVSIAALLVIPFLGEWWLRLGFALLILAGFAFDQVMLEIAQQPMSSAMMEVLWRNKNMASDAYETYHTSIAKVAMLVVALLVLIMLPPPKRAWMRARFAAIPLAAFVLVAAIVLTTNGRIEALPSPFVVPAHFVALQATSPGAESEVDRWAVGYNRPIHRTTKTIVMVVDESVRGDYLQINDPRFDNTPFLAASSKRIANFGVAISGANCSQAARLFLRAGLRPDQLPDTKGLWARVPTIWQFAKKAGYRTVLIDAFSTTRHSYMNGKEAEHIDTVISTASAPFRVRDNHVADKVNELLKVDEPLFIYVNKLGIHPPYNSTYPLEFQYDPRFIAPAPRSKPNIIKGYQRLLVADYHRAVKWSVDNFFQRIFPAVLKSGATLIYTSDHGQSMFESGYDLSHCSLSMELNHGEVFVPLFVVSGDEKQNEKFQAAAREGYNRTNHFEIFPTLLEMMGYAPDWVRSEYGPNLWNMPKTEPRGFLMGTFYRPGAIWVESEYPPRPR